MGSSPTASQSRTKLLPMKPAPPVVRIMAHHTPVWAASARQALAQRIDRISALQARHALLDRPEDRFALLVQHLDPHRVPKTHELRHRRAVLDHLEAALFGDA